MQIEKKLILCSVLAVAIGIAAVVPIAFLMTPATASAQTTDAPWFNLNINYAACKSTMVFSKLNAMYTYVYNFSVNPEAVDAQADGRIEYYRVQIYSDQKQLTNESIAIVANSSKAYDPSTFQFSQQNWFNTSDVQASNIDFMQIINGTIHNYAGCRATTVCIAESDQLSDGTNGNDQIQNIRNAQTIYIDVHRVGYITFTGNNTVVSLANDEIAQHYELTKSGDVFSYGIRPNGYMADQIP
jgi:hypothetical protein